MWTFDVPGFDDALGTALEFARRGVFLEPGSQLTRLILAYASYLADDSKTFREESETALALNPNSPYTVGAIGYMHVLRGERERGLALLGRLGRIDEAQPHLKAALEQKPNLATRVRELMRRGLKIDPLIDDLVDGLHAAGLPIS